MTSLLDIVMILLFFLIKYYCSSTIDIQTPQGMKLPQAQAKSEGSNNLSVVVDQNQKISISGKVLCTVQGNQEKNECLYNELLKRKPASVSDESVNILVHKSHPYKVVKEIMHTCAMAGRGQFKLIVEAKYQ